MHVNGRHIFAVFRDPAKRRLLIVISPDSGTITIKKNNLRIANNQLSTATITIIDHKYLADGSSVADPDNTSPLRVGAWLPFSLKDTLDIEGAIGLNTKSKFSLRYHTDSGWASSMAKPIFEAGVIKKADAYHFTEDSLLDDIRRVLAKKNACRVKMKQNQILTITRWKKDPKALFDPVIVKVTDSIFINEKTAEEKLENLQELKFRLDSYCSAAKAGGHEPKVLLRTSRNTKDSLLKKALEAFQFVHIRHVSLAPVPPVNPPRKRIHQPLPRKP